MDSRVHYYSLATRAEIEANVGHSLSAPLAVEKFYEAAQAALLPYTADLHGHSPRRDLRAAAMNGSTQVTCIEHYSTAMHHSHLRAEADYRLNETPTQRVALFTSLAAGHILFIHRSHVAQPGSDVEFLIFEVLPRIVPGALAHVHNIFLPRGYTNHYYLDQNRHWNENYLLGALPESPRWQVWIANAFVVGFGVNAALEAMAASLAGGGVAKRNAFAEVTGGGIWLRRLPG